MSYSQNPHFRIQKYIGTCLGKQDQAGYQIIYDKHLTWECDFEMGNLHYKKMYNTVANIYTLYSRTKHKFIYISGNQQLYLLHRN